MKFIVIHNNGDDITGIAGVEMVKVLRNDFAVIADMPIYEETKHFIEDANGEDTFIYNGAVMRGRWEVEIKTGFIPAMETEEYKAIAESVTDVEPYDIKKITIPRKYRIQKGKEPLYKEKQNIYYVYSKVTVKMPIVEFHTVEEMVEWMETLYERYTIDVTRYTLDGVELKAITIH
jgi:hypothetical protein